MTDHTENSGDFAEDMAEYLQTFLDETEEQLDDLVETMLVLERDSTNQESLDESFRLIHSIKGSAGMMGLDSIAVLTHHLENRFERFRSGTSHLDEPAMNLVLRCIDFLRQCNNRLRVGEQLGSSAELLEALRQLEAQGDNPAIALSKSETTQSGTIEPQDLEKAALPSPESGSPAQPHDHDDLTRVIVRFRPDLPLVDLKAQLLVTRLSRLGEVQSTQPDLQQLSADEAIEQFEVRIEGRPQEDLLRDAADVDGVESIEVVVASAESSGEAAVSRSTRSERVADQPAAPSPPADDARPLGHPAAGPSSASGAEDTASDERPAERPDPAAPRPAVASPEPQTETPQIEPPHPETVAASKARPKEPTKVAETMRVDIDRLNHLMNLAGELVVNRARFVQISGQLSPALRKASMVNRIRDFGDGLRRTIESLENADNVGADWSAQIQYLRAGLKLMDEQSEIWDNGRHCLGQISEAIDQLTRVSHSLQRGVLDTRMVPIGPLFTRFNRVVRDLSKERGKRVHLQIRGEKTELDKRMVDELGDPLVHLVRNSIDHGLESPDVRVGRGKPEVGTISLEASHSGNSVYIHVRDDGGGINVHTIKEKLLEKRLFSQAAIEEMTEDQALDCIWHPGFSTAKEVTDVSGRGVGMDVVKTRIKQLNGTIEVNSTLREGTTFTIRLPLTLAIINSLLVRMRGVHFSMPIDDVRDIVSVKERDVVTVHGKQTIDVRGQFIPLVGINGVFRWHGIDYGHGLGKNTDPLDTARETVEVVILSARGKTLGLRVDELLGSHDMVIKSLSDNFVHIRGLSGASILGDGTVCLMLDVGTVIETVTRSSRTVETEEVAN